MKKIISGIIAITMLLCMLTFPVNAEGITVVFNGQSLEFDVEPIIMNGRTMVPMRAIFEALGCNVAWDSASQQAIGIKNGKKVVVAIGNNTAYIDGEFAEIDQPPVLINSRTLVPLRFISEAYGCDVSWDGNTQTVTIKNSDSNLHFHLDALSFGVTGDWARDGSALKGRITRDSFIEKGEEIPVDESAVASGNIEIVKDGTYRVWVLARDYATNQQGSRYFKVGVDDFVFEKTFGQHGKEGFIWEEAGIFEFSKGVHSVKLIDTSAFYARCQGVFITNDLSYIPASYEDALEKCPAMGAVPNMPVDMYPTWTQELFAPAKTNSIQNDKFKIEFYQGMTSVGPVAQYAVFVNDSGNWIEVKGRGEESAYMLQRADKSSYSTTVKYEYVANTEFELNGQSVNVSTDNIYEMAPLSWCIPVDYTVISDNKIALKFSNVYADIIVTFEFDDKYPEPLVTLNSTFNKEGSYSFILYNGNGVGYDDFDTVTAPLLYVKHALPEKPYVITEPFMFTPMNTLYYSAERNLKGNSKEFTNGLTVDPSIVRQGFSYPETAEYGTTFYTVDKKIRPHLVAPVMGDNNHFNTGDGYEFKFRILSGFNYWYDTFKHVGIDMFNVKDIRDNYYTSYNEAIYNTTELWLDDFYGGWDDKAMSYYNMEAKDVTTQADPLEAAQRYMLTDDLTILEERTVPTIAYMLSRETMSFQYTADKEGLTSSYITTEVPSPIGSPVNYSAGVYGGLYEMTQGRMPYLLEYAVNHSNASQIPSLAALYRYTGDEGYKRMLVLKADEYLEKTSCMSADNYYKGFTTGFVYTDYARLLNTLLLAYEYTGDEKYLDAADKAGQLTMTSTWNTGYHNGYDYNTYVIDETTGDRPHPHDGNKMFFWHGSYQWRVGNEIGEYKSANELGLEIPSESVPGWLPAQAGLGTEHPFTPRYGAINQLNVWAGSIMRLAKYTGDEYYVTQARNAMIGRFGNYSGYGRERYITHNQHPDFPYKGPDYVTIYYHHIPVFMGMLEDFLINDVWYRSDANIEFPMVFQQGYAYFDMNRYGQAAGKFYDENDMWLWITPDIVSPDNRSIDYVAARKEGTLGVAFVNQKTEPVTTTITLGEKVDNASDVNCVATVYDKNGNKSNVNVVNGSFTITVPAKGITSVIIKNDGIHKPTYAREYKYSTQLGQTVSEHTNGKGYVIQMSDAMYHAYTYVTDKDLKKLEITYTADGETKTAVCDSYPFEFIIKVNDVNSDFVYSLKATLADGTIKDMGNGLLRTLDNSEGVDKNAGVVVTSGEHFSLDGSSVYTNEKTKAPEFKTTKAQINRIGRGSDSWKFIVEKSTFPFEVNDENVQLLKNIGVVMKWVHRTENKVIDAASYVNFAEMADNGERIALYVTSTFELPATVYSFDNSNYKITMDVYHDSPRDVPVGITVGEEKTIEFIDFKPIELKINARGRDGVNWRFVTNLDSIPFEVAEGSMVNMRVVAEFTHKTDGSVRVLDSVVKKNEMRDDGKSITIVVPATESVPMKNKDGSTFDDSVYNVKFILAPVGYTGKIEVSEENYNENTDVNSKDEVVKLDFKPFEIKILGKGRSGNMWRYVVSNESLPFDVTEGCMKGINIEAIYTHKTTKEKLVMKSTVSTNEMRSDGVSTTLVVPSTKDVPTNYPDGTVFDDSEYNIKITLSPAK